MTVLTVGNTINKMTETNNRTVEYLDNSGFLYFKQDFGCITQAFVWIPANLRFSELRQLNHTNVWNPDLQITVADKRLTHIYIW